MRIKWWPAVEWTLGLFSEAVRAATCAVKGHDWDVAGALENQKRLIDLAIEARLSHTAAAIARDRVTVVCTRCGKEREQ